MTPGSTNEPSWLVVVSFSVPVWVLISLTLAPEMLALVESSTMPATVAVLTWAPPRIPEQEARKNIRVRMNPNLSNTVALRFIVVRQGDAAHPHGSFARRAGGFETNSIPW